MEEEKAYKLVGDLVEFYTSIGDFSPPPGKWRHDLVQLVISFMWQI